MSALPKQGLSADEKMVGWSLNRNLLVNHGLIRSLQYDNVWIFNLRLGLLALLFNILSRVDHIISFSFLPYNKTYNGYHCYMIHPKQWQMDHTSDLMMMMIIRWSACIITISIREMGKLNTHSPIYCIIKRWFKNWPYLRNTLDGMYLTSILEFQYLHIRLHYDDDEVVWCAMECVHQAINHYTIMCAHLKTAR